MFNSIDTRSRTKLLSAAGAVALSLLSAFSPAAASAQPASLGKEKPTVILVHGAWADGSSWNGGIARLLKLMHLRSAVGIVLALLFSPKLPSFAVLFERKFWRWGRFGAQHNLLPDCIA